MKPLTEKRLRKSIKRRSKRLERRKYWEKIAHDNWKYADEHPTPWPVFVDARGATLSSVMEKYLEKT